MRLTEKDGHLSEFYRVSDDTPCNSTQRLVRRDGHTRAALQRNVVVVLGPAAFLFSLFEAGPAVPDHSDPPELSEKTDNARAEQNERCRGVASKAGQERDEQWSQEFAKEKRSTKPGVENGEVIRIGCRGRNDEDPGDRFGFQSQLRCSRVDQEDHETRQSRSTAMSMTVVDSLPMVANAIRPNKRTNSNKVNDEWASMSVVRGRPESNLATT